MRKLFVSILFLLIMCLLVVSCGKIQDNNSVKDNNEAIQTGILGDGTNTSESTKEIIEIVQKFFNAFETADYKSMKTLCTQNCIEKYFNDDGVFGMISAKATKLEDDIRTLSDKEYRVFVDVEMKPSKISTFSSKETSTSFYLIVEKQDDESWLINNLTTG